MNRRRWSDDHQPTWTRKCWVLFGIAATALAAVTLTYSLRAAL